MFESSISVVSFKYSYTIVFRIDINAIVEPLRSNRNNQDRNRIIEAVSRDYNNNPMYALEIQKIYDYLSLFEEGVA